MEPFSPGACGCDYFMSSKAAHSYTEKSIFVAGLWSEKVSCMTYKTSQDKKQVSIFVKGFLFPWAYSS